MVETKIKDIMRYIQEGADMEEEFKLRMERLVYMIQSNSSYDEHIKAIAYPTPLANPDTPPSSSNSVKGIEDLLTSLEKTISDMTKVIQAQYDETVEDYKDYMCAWLAFTRLSQEDADLVRRKYIFEEKLDAIASSHNVSKSTAHRLIASAENNLLYFFGEIKQQVS